MHNEIGRQIVNLELMISKSAREINHLSDIVEKKRLVSYALGLYLDYVRLAGDFGLAKSEIERVGKILNGSLEYKSN